MKSPGADGRLIARAIVAGGSQFLYALTDAQNSVTALVEYATLSGQSAPSWQVVQRFTYDQNGSYVADNSQFSYPAPISNWTILWHSMVLRPMLTGDKLYTSLTGSNLYDPLQARFLTPSPGNTYSYDPQGGEWWLQRSAENWYNQNAGYIALGAGIGLGVAGTILTGGLAASALLPEGATLASAGLLNTAAIAGAGGAGGLGLTGGVQGYSSGGWTGGLEGGAIGAIAGGIGGALGALAAPLGSAAFIESGLQCGIGAGLASGAVNGLVAGGVQGGWSGYQQTGTLAGALAAAGEGALTGGLIGGLAGAGIGGTGNRIGGQGGRRIGGHLVS